MTALVLGRAVTALVFGRAVTALVLLALGQGASAAPIVVDRVDLISEDPGTFLAHDAGRAALTPRFTAVRYAAQVKLVLGMPLTFNDGKAHGGVYLGLSASSQSIVLERALVSSNRAGLYGTAGVQTLLGLPRGGLLGVATRVGPVRLGVSASLLSGATWSRPDYRAWTLLPGLGLGVGRSAPPVSSAGWDPW